MVVCLSRGGWASWKGVRLMRKKIVGALSALALCLAVAPAAAFAESGWTGWTELTASTTEIGGTAGAKYYLNDDVIVGDTLQIKDGTEGNPVVLDLNGHTLSGSIKVDSGACLMLRNSCGAIAGDTTYTGSHTDETPKDHKCDTCGVEVGTCEDVGKDHKCDYGCGKTFGVCSGGAATCKDKAVCDYRHKPYGELDSSTHAGGTEGRNAKDATCTEDGYTGDTHCKGCDTKLSSGKSVDKTGHDYESKVTKEATTTSTGTKTYSCKNCGHSYEEEIAKLTSSFHSGEPAGSDEPLAKTGEPAESDEPLAKTGDNAPAAVAAVAALMLAGGAAALAARRRCA